MGNWESFIKNNNLPVAIYGFDHIKNLIGDSNTTVLLRIKEITILIEDFLFKDIPFQSSSSENLGDFKLLSHSKRWDILLKSNVVSFGTYKHARELVRLIDQPLIVTKANLDTAISGLEKIIDALAMKMSFETPNIPEVEEESRDYDLFPPVVHIFQTTNRSNVLERFWDVFVVHYELDIRKYSYDLIKTMAKYNAPGAFNHLKVLMRYLVLARVNYLAEANSKRLEDDFVDREQFARLSTEKAWEKMYMSYNLSIEEYHNVKKLVAILAHEQVPKNVVIEAFQLFEKLVLELGDAVKAQQTRKVNKATVAVAQSVTKETVATTYKEIVFSVKQLETPVVKDVASAKLTEEVKDNNQPVKYGSVFLQKIKGLQKSSNETVVNANKLGDFQSYMHVERKIERDTIAMLEQMQASSEPQLLLLLGSVGDGKSHLLAYLKVTKPHLFENVYVHNDATESHERTRPAEETLERIIAPFEGTGENKRHIVIAINYGKLHNFYLMQKDKGTFHVFRGYIDSLQIFNHKNEVAQNDRFAHFHTVDFSKEKYYSISETGAHSPFFSDILAKIAAPVEENEIYQAWLSDKEAGKWTMAHENYALFMNPMVRKRIVEKVIHVIIRNKMIISTREFYNFIVDIIVPAEILLKPQNTAFALSNSLPNLLFNHPERSAILSGLNELDPVFVKSSLNDELIASVFMHPDLPRYLKDVIEVDGEMPYEVYWKNAMILNERLDVARFVICLKELINEENANSDFRYFVRYLYAYHKGDGDVIEEIFSLLEKVVFHWKGSPTEGYAYITSNLKKDFRIAIPMNLEGTLNPDLFGSVEDQEIYAANHYITLGFNDINFDLDLKLFEILRQVSNGHRPNLHEVGQAIQFEDFYNKLVKHLEDKEKKLLVVHIQTNKQYEISKPKFAKSKFEVKKV